MNPGKMQIPRLSWRSPRQIKMQRRVKSMSRRTQGEIKPIKRQSKGYNQRQNRRIPM